MPRRFAFRFALLASLLLLPALPASSADDDGKKDGGKGDGKETSFADAVKEFDKIEGLFTLYHKKDENKVLMEIAPEQFGPIFLCSLQREAGDGQYFDSGAMEESFPFVLERVGKKVRFVHKNVYYRADREAPIVDAVERGVTSSLLGSAEIAAAPHPKRKSVLIDPSKLFLRDHIGVAAALGEEKLDYKFDADESFFSLLKSFPRNTEIEVTLRFTSEKRRPTAFRIPDSRSMEHRYHYSLVALPESDYRPRLADDRVGYFLTPFQDYSSLTEETPYTWYINRWNLKKKNPKEPVSDVVAPIVFWLENTVPLEYRAAVQEGALLWNAAFERAGFRNALVVKQMPDDADWDPADVRYNTIRWIVMPGGGYAVGPSHADPFTGEIFASDIRLSADFVRYFYLSYEEFVNPVARGMDAPWGEGPAPSGPRDLCRYSEGKALDAAFGSAVLAARGYVDPDSPEMKRFIHEGIVDLVAHEVGHTLGLRHNYRASTIHTPAELHDKAVTQREGIAGSVMDYNPVNLAPEGRAQGHYWAPAVGTYDLWAVEYGYTPIEADSPEGERTALLAIAAKSSDPKNAYATDEDAFGYSQQGVDPVTNLWDLGNDPLAYYDSRLNIARELLAGIESQFDKPGERYTKYRFLLGRVYSQYRGAAAGAAKYVGGLYQRRDHIGEAGGRLPFEPVAAAKQREAMAFLKARIFAPDALPIPASLANKLAPERLEDFDWSAWYQPRVDPALHEAMLGVHRAALDRLYHPITLNRLLDVPLHAAPGADAYTMEEMFRDVRQAVWTELDTRRNVDSMRRNLQREHLGRLAALLVQPGGTPVYTPASGSEPAGELMPPRDAGTLARADLQAIQGGIDKAIAAGGLNGITRAHFEESRAIIATALQAGVERKL